MSVNKQRRLFFTLTMISVLACVNWLINSRKFDNIQIFENKKQMSLYYYSELSNKNSIGQQNEKKTFTLNSFQYSIETTIDQAESIISNETYIQKQSIKILRRLNREDVIDILKLFYSNKVCLLNVNILKNIQIIKRSNHSMNFNLLRILKLNNYFITSSKLETNQNFLTFGISYLGFGKLYKDLIKKISTKCNVIKTQEKSNNQDIPTGLYVECYDIMFHLCVIYRRGSFLWIPSDNNFKTNKQNANKLETKYFGDISRAIQKFELREINDVRLYKIYVPSDIDRFLFDYGHSKFIECNKKLAKYNLKIMGAKFKQNENKNKMIAPVIEHITQTLESLRKHYWLAGGTLLGWYRECGIIPYTQDVDIALWAREYDNRIKEKFLGNEIVRVWSTLGLVNDSFEFRLFNDHFTFDMFLVYPFNSTDQWCGYQVNRTKYRRFLPFFNELCSAELLSQKFIVPCDPEAYLEKEYGSKRWRTPQSKNYQWDNVKYWTNWTDSEWPRTVRYYDRQGNLIKNKTREHINRFLRFNITSDEFERLI